LLAGATVAIVLLIVFLSKWSSPLGREVQRRTMELELSNGNHKSSKPCREETGATIF
jgi:hypothetical protein